MGSVRWDRVVITDKGRISSIALRAAVMSTTVLCIDPTVWIVVVNQHFLILFFVFLEWLDFGGIVDSVLIFT